MAKRTTELNILITVASEAKQALTEIVSQLGGVKEVLDGIGEGTGTQPLIDALGKIGEEVSGVGENAKNAAEGIDTTNASVSGLTAGFEKLLSIMKFVAGGFLAIEAVSILKEWADAAARTETLGVVLQTVGQNAGYTSAQLTTTDHAVQKLGITAEASRQSLTQLIQSGLSLDFAGPLARAAQDLAVVSGVNSSETFSKLVTNIQQLDTMGLRFMGIIIDKERVFAQAAQETGKAISGTLEKTVFANAVLAEAAKLTGLYEASMLSAGKALTSMPRYIDNLKTALGESLQPAYLQAILGTQRIIKSLTELAQAFQTPAVNADLFGDAVEGSADAVSPLADAVKATADSLVGMVKWVKENKDEIVLIVKGIGYAIAALLIFKATVLTISVLTAVFTGFAQAFALIRTLGLGAALAVTFFGRAATVAGLSVSIAWAPLTATILAVGAAIAGVIWLFDKLTGSADAAGKAQSKGAKELVDEYEVALNAAERLRKANNLAQDEARKAKNNAAANPTDKNADGIATKAQKDATAAAAALTKQLEVITELKSQLANSEELKELTELKNRVKELDAASQARVLALRKETDAQLALSEALQKAGADYGKYLSGIDSKTEAKIGALRAAIEQLGRAKGSDIESSLLETLSLAENLSKDITSDRELAKYKLELESLSTEAAKFGLNFKAATAGALGQAESNLAAYKQNLAGGGAAAVADAKNTARRTAQLEREKLQGSAELNKLHRQHEQDLDKAFFDRGLQNLDGYYTNRIKAIEEGHKEEQAAQLAFIQGEIERKEFETDGAKKIQIQAEIEQAKTKLLQQTARTQNEIQKLEIDRLNQRVTLEREVAAITSDLNRQQGNEEAAIRQENSAALEKELEHVNQLGDARAVELVKKKYAFQQEKQLADAKLSMLQRELDLRGALLSLEEAVLSLQYQRGNITTLAYDEKLNDLVRERVVDLEKEFDLTKKLRDEAYATGRIEAGNAGNTKMAQLQKEMVQLIATFKSIGETIKASFTDSIASNFEAIITRTKSFKQGMLDIFKDLNSQILKVITKDIAEDFVHGLDGLGKGKDGKGPGLFDQAMSVFTGKPAQSAPEVDKARQDAILKQNVAAAAATEKFEATKVTNGTLGHLSATSKSTEATALNTSNIVKRLEADSAKREAERAKGFGSVPKTFIPGTDAGEVGGAAPSNLAEHAEITVKKLQALGLSFEKAAGITANIQRESSFDPKAVGDGGKAFGLAQWHPDRQEDFKKMFGIKMQDSNTDQQLQFLVEELRNKEKKAGAALDKTKTPFEAGSVFSKTFERPLDPTGKEAKLRGDLATQIASDITGKSSKTEPVPVQIVANDGKPLDPLDSQKDMIPTNANPNPIQLTKRQQLEQGVTVGLGTHDVSGKITQAPEKQAKAATEQVAATVSATVAQKEAEAATAKSTTATEAATAGVEKLGTAVEQAAAKVTPAAGTAPPATATAEDVLKGPKGFSTDPVYVRLVDAPNTGPARVEGALPGAGEGKEAPNVTEEKAAVTAKATVDAAERNADSKPALPDTAGNQLPSAPSAAEGAFGVVKGFAPALGAAAGGKLGGPMGGTLGAIVGTLIGNMDTKKMFEGLTGNLEKGFEGVKTAADSGDLGIGSFFSSFGSVITGMFSSMSSAMSGGGSGSGGMFGSLAVMAVSFFGGSTGGADQYASGGGNSGQYAEGGYVSGPGTGTSDSINAKLSDGEYVMTAEKTSRYLPMLEAMRNGTLDNLLNGVFSSMKIDIPRSPAYAGGGFVSSSVVAPAAKSARSITVVQNISTPDANSFRRSRDQVAADMGAAANRTMRRNR